MHAGLWEFDKAKSLFKECIAEKLAIVGEDQTMRLEQQVTSYIEMIMGDKTDASVKEAFDELDKLDANVNKYLSDEWAKKYN